MPNFTLEEYIKDEQEKLNKRQIELDSIVSIKNQVPELNYTFNRSRQLILYSPTVNSEVTHAKIILSCGCCSDAEVQATFYKIVDDIRVYTKPRTFGLGEACYNAPFEGWRDNIEKAGISWKLIREIRKQMSDYFSKPNETMKPFDLEEYI